MAGDNVIQDYLSQLRKQLGRGVDVDAVISEANDHLQQSAEELRAAGCSIADGNRLAIQRFGDPVVVARELLRHQTGRPSTLTKSASVVAVAGALILVVAFAPLTYLALVGGQRTRVVLAVQLFAGLAQLALVAMMIGVVLRAAKRPRRAILLLAIVPVSVFAAANLGFYLVADLAGTGWVIPAMQAVLVIALAVLLVPWSAGMGYGPRWARVCLIVPALLMLASSSLAAIADSVSTDWIGVNNSTILVQWLSVPLLIAGMLAIGRKLWTEQSRAIRPA